MSFLCNSGHIRLTFGCDACKIKAGFYNFDSDILFNRIKNRFDNICDLFYETGSDNEKLNDNLTTIIEEIEILIEKLGSYKHDIESSGSSATARY
jgi:hypothetical protein